MYYLQIYYNFPPYDASSRYESVYFSTQLTKEDMAIWTISFKVLQLNYKK